MIRDDPFTGDSSLCSQRAVRCYDFFLTGARKFSTLQGFSNSSLWSATSDTYLLLRSKKKIHFHKNAVTLRIFGVGRSDFGRIHISFWNVHFWGFSRNVFVFWTLSELGLEKIWRSGSKKWNQKIPKSQMHCSDISDHPSSQFVRLRRVFIRPDVTS